MKLDEVQIQQFRNLSKIVVHPSEKLNFICGLNGSGKSSFLEALHYLGYGRSFRTSKHKNVIQHDAENFNVFCRCTDDQGGNLKLGMSRGQDDSFVVSVNGEKTNRLSEIVSLLPIQIFTPQSSELVLGSPSQRRRFLDWGLFHVEHSFPQASKNYSRLVKQKNALLRQMQNGVSENQASHMHFWDNQIVLEGETITKLRKSFLEAIKERIYANLSHFLPEFSLEISYYRGWEKGIDLRESIQNKTQKDIRNGYVSVGPHKADLKITFNGVDVSESLSRGQLRMLVAALQLAQIQYLAEATGKSSVFLLDDIGAELDESKRELFLDKLIESDTQLFVTAIEKSQLPFIDKYNNKKMFHVEHGHMREES